MHSALPPPDDVVPPMPIPQPAPTASQEELDGWLRGISGQLAVADAPLETSLARLCPAILRQLRDDAGRPELWPLWGESLNFDEFAHQAIIDPRLLHQLCDLVGQPQQTSSRSHAGLQHTYGYLFSSIETPFGFKRARWVSPAIEQGFGIGAPCLRPIPARGSLLTNLSWFLGKVAFRGCPRQQQRLQALEPDVAPQLRALDFSALRVRRLREEVKLVDGRSMQLLTDLLRFSTAPEPGAADTLLIYGVRQPPGAPRLITAFTVEPGFLASLVSELGPDLPVRSRFNAYVEGLTGEEHLGRRELLPETAADQNCEANR